MTENTIHLITGANRGIGLGMVQQLLLRPNTTIIATVRHEKTDAQLLINAPKHSTSVLHITHLTLGDELSAQALQASLARHAITKIDVIIANAGIANAFTPCLDASASSLLEHFTINTLGPLLLFQALWPLLSKSPQPKFILISSALASMKHMSAYDGPTVSYGISKAGANYLIKKLHFEHDALATLAVHPGWVNTANGQAYADCIGYPNSPPLSVEESARDVLEQIDSVSKSIDPSVPSMSGSFVDNTNNPLEY